jgi:hypothetical protein
MTPDCRIRNSGTATAWQRKRLLTTTLIDECNGTRRSAMERGNSKVSPRVDEQLQHETQGLVRGGHDTHAEEWKTSEPSGEDQPDVSRDPESHTELDARSELASYLNPGEYPAIGSELVTQAIDNQAPDRIIDRLRTLPADRRFENLQEIWTALGGQVREQRF